MSATPPHTPLHYRPAAELAADIRAGRMTATEVVDQVFARIHTLNPRLNAYCTLDETRARVTAAQRDAEVGAGQREDGRPLGPLHGVPFSVKDLITTAGVRTMRGSKIFEQYVPDEDAPAVARLKDAGAILLGKTATSEFGAKGVTESPVSGVSYNPWDTARTPGGSSGGAAAAVAAGLGPIALATDGGGSIRLPAAFNGVFGFKPSFGCVPAYPPAPVPSVLHLGPITRTVRDAALMLDVLAGPDPRDANSLPLDGTDYVQAVDATPADLRGLRVAWSADLGFAPVDAEVRAIAAAAAKRFADAAGLALHAATPDFGNANGIASVLWTCGLGAYLRDYLYAWQFKLDRDVLRRIEGQHEISGTAYAIALAQRNQLVDRAQGFFQDFDLLLTPTVPLAAFAAGEPPPTHIDGKSIADIGFSPFTTAFNLTGQPAASVPCGFTAGGLPVGLQIIGRRLDDAAVLRASAVFERVSPWQDRLPPLDQAPTCQDQRIHA